MGVCVNGRLHKAGVSPDPADRGGLQSGRKHCMQVPGREQDEPGASAVLCQRLSGVQRSQVCCCPLIS